MRHPLMINKTGKLSTRPPMHRLDILVDGYVVGSVDQDDFIPGKGIKMVPNGILTPLGDCAIFLDYDDIILGQRMVKLSGNSI